MTITNLHVPLLKHYRNEQGHLVVEGRCTGPDLDLDEQVMDPAWLEKAIPRWYATGANVREMHGGIAAGRGEELTRMPDGGYNLKSVIVDRGSAAKVEAGVLTGYSIGVRNALIQRDKAATGGRCVGGDVLEISLVDRPANPSCQLTLAKAAKPGMTMTVKSGDFDPDHMMIRVEEFRELEKVEKTADVVTIPTVVEKTAGPVRLEVVGGADSALGEFISQLIKSGQIKINNNEEAPVADTTVDATKGTETDTTKTTDADTTKGVGDGQSPNIASLVEAAVTKALAPHLAVLQKVATAPADGAPVITRTEADANKAAGSELLTKAANYERLAEQISDPNMAELYRAEAASLRKSA
jgi:hypothetical protein